MRNRERVLASLAHRWPDKIPYEVMFTHKAHARMAEFYGDPNLSFKLGNCLTWLGCEPADGWKQAEPDIWKDQLGVRWDRTIDKDIGVVSNRLSREQVWPITSSRTPMIPPDTPGTTTF